MTSAQNGMSSPSPAGWTHPAAGAPRSSTPKSGAAEFGLDFENLGPGFRVELWADPPPSCRSAFCSAAITPPSSLTLTVPDFYRTATISPPSLISGRRGSLSG